MDTRMKMSRSYLMATAATGLALLMAAPALAQDADEPIATEAADAVEDAEARLDTVKVTGIRASIASSVAQKRNSTSIVEAISAEDIGKLPDNSIAESLARLPGLTAQRLRGRAQVISVRGLGPDFTTALLNGREQVTAGDNRGVEFDQYPSELLSSVVVYKTPDAALVGAGLAGTADLRTIRPLDSSERSFSVGARYELSDLGELSAGSDDDGYRITGAYVDQFANDTVGVFVSAAVQSSPTQAERFEAWGYPTVDGLLAPGGVKPYVESRELERTAFTGTVQFEPTSNFRTTVDAFYSDFSDEGTLRGVEIPLVWGGRPLENAQGNNGILTSGRFLDTKGVVRNDFRGREAELISAGWNLQYDITDKFTVEGDLSFSSVSRDDVDLETYSGTGNGNGNFITGGATPDAAVILNSNGVYGFSIPFDYGNQDNLVLTDPQGWGQVGFIKRPKTEDELTAIRLSAEYDFDMPFISSVEGGVNYTTREKSKRSVEDFIDLANPGLNNEAAFPAGSVIGTSSLGFMGIGDIVSYDPVALLNSGVYALRPNVNDDVRIKAWDVSEDVITAYVMGNIEADLGSVPMRGNVGIQVVQTDQSSTGPSLDGSGTVVNVTDGDEYTEVLPSLNLSFELPADQFIRVGAARSLARARMDQLAVSRTVSVDAANLTAAEALGSVPVLNGRYVLNGGGGNPLLRPYVANSYDLGYEKYFGSSGGYFSAALFYKDIVDFIDPTNTVLLDASNAAGGLLTADQLQIPGITTAAISGPVNFEGGYIRGLEFATSIPFDTFTDGYLSGFGVLASVSFTETEIQPDDSDQPQAIEGFSETVGNITAYYEYGGFEARISQRWRTDFLGEVTGFGAGRTTRDVFGEQVVDAQIGYEIQSGPLDGLGIQLQANNLTDEEFRTYANGDKRQVIDVQQYGTTYLLGLNYRF